MADKSVSTMSVAVGDHVRLRSRDINQYSAHEKRAGVMVSHEPVDGLVLAIRDIQSGKLVTRSDGELDQYILEVLVDTTFNSRFASINNAPRGVERPTSTNNWRQIRRLLRETSANGEVFTSSRQEELAKSPLARFMDGWKVLKVWSTELTSLEKAVPTPTEETE